MIAPTPWTVDEDSINMMWSNSIGIRDAEGAHVAHTTRGYEDGPSMANARLLAAAPELMESLRKAVHELNAIRARDGVPYTHQMMKASVTEEYFSSVVDECFAAIAKAEGR